MSNNMLEQILVKYNYSLYDLALEIGVSESSLYKYRNNYPLGNIKNKIEKELQKMVAIK